MTELEIIILIIFAYLLPYQDYKNVKRNKRIHKDDDERDNK